MAKKITSKSAKSPKKDGRSKPGPKRKASQQPFAKAPNRKTQGGRMKLPQQKPVPPYVGASPETVNEMLDKFQASKGDEQRPDPTAQAAPTIPAVQNAEPSTATSTSPLAAALGKVLAASSTVDNAPHLIVTARAGTGKTTTLIESLRRLKGQPTPGFVPSPQQQAVFDCVELSRGKANTVCFVAFNKSIADELKSRVPPGVEAMTMHSMGMRAVLKAFPELRSFDLNEGRNVVPGLIASLLGQPIWSVRKDPKLREVLNATDKLVSLCKMNLTDLWGVDYAVKSWQRSQLSDLASQYEVELNGSTDQVFRLVPEVLELCKQHRTGFNFDDMIWLPVALGLPVAKYDLLLVDECLPGWTPVMLADGSSKTIKEIVDSEDSFMVRSYSTKLGRGVDCRVIGKQKMLNQKPLVKIKAKHLHKTGTNRKCNFVICTVDHRVWTINRGWVEAGNIVVGDSVIIETEAHTTQKGKTTAAGRNNLAQLQAGNQRGLGNRGGDPAAFNRIKGGNGRGPTLAESTLIEALGGDWSWNLPVATGLRPAGYPTCYKIDVANPTLKIAIEIDGQSHRHLQEVDDRKTTFLESQGWRVIRVTNRDAIQKTSSVLAQVAFLAEGLPVCQGDNCPKPAEVVSVESVTIPDSYVYDITVETCHNFYANGILVHNCQDLNRCQQALAKKAGKRLVLCGDPMQAIYGFAGADAESMPRMAKELSNDGEINGKTFAPSRGCVTLPLTVTRRCGKAIVREANKLVRDFEAFETNPEGRVLHMLFLGKATKTADGYSFDRSGIDLANQPEPFPMTESAVGYQSRVKEGDLILCRVNSRLISQCLQFIKAGRRAYIQGKDVGKGLAALVEKQDAQTVADLINKISLWCENEVAKEQAKVNPSESVIEAIRDKVACVIALTDGLDARDHVASVVRKLDSLFSDQRQENSIKLSSIHKAKGTEARRVFFLALPSKKKDMPPAWTMTWIKDPEQELNLHYVAVTRAIEELCYVS